MNKKTSEFEKYLGIGMVIFLSGQLMKLLPTESANLLMIYLMSISGLFAIIKIARFYKQANNRINIIWTLSLAVILTGITLLLLKYKIGLGVATAGSAVFWLTWYFTFLANRPDIK